MEESEKKAQEVYAEYQAVDQHVKQLQKQLEMLTSQLMEINATSRSLDEFGKIQAGKGIFVPLSSGIFAKAEIKNTSELLVNVGANVAVRKDIASTKNLIQKQFDEMKSIQRRMIDDLEKMTGRAAQLEAQLQGMIG